MSLSKFIDATQWILHNNHSYDFGKAGFQVNMLCKYFMKILILMFEDNKRIPLLLRKEILKINEQMDLVHGHLDKPGSEKNDMPFSMR